MQSPAIKKTWLYDYRIFLNETDTCGSIWFCMSGSIENHISSPESALPLPFIFHPLKLMVTQNAWLLSLQSCLSFLRFLLLLFFLPKSGWRETGDTGVRNRTKEQEKGIGNGSGQGKTNTTNTTLTLLSQAHRGYVNHVYASTWHDFCFFLSSYS